MQLCSVFLKFKKKQKTNKQNNLTDAWQVVLGTAPAIKKKNSLPECDHSDRSTTG